MTKRISTHFITELIKPLGPLPGFTEPDSTVPLQPQIPSAVAVSRELVVVSNGVGDIELVGIEEKNGKILGASLGSACYLGEGNEGISPVPCMLLTARRAKQKIILVVYSHTASKTTEFNIATLQLDIPTADTEKLEDGSFVLLLKTLHIQKGPEVPVYCAITPSGQRCIFASEVKYNRVRLSATTNEEEEEESEPMDIVKEAKPAPPTYQWSQEGADITLLFQLPQGTTKSNINCKFVKDHLILLVQSGDAILVSYPYRKLWSTVKPDECVWTYDAKTGLLSLFMTKMDAYTRWPQLFDHDDGVLETISPAQLQDIQLRMEKFTATPTAAEEQTSKDMVLKPAQHPAATDMDEDIDEAGQPVIFSVYDMDGNEVDEFSSGGYSWICKSYDSVSQPLPSICLQMDVDGLVFKVEEDATDHTVKINHDATFDAFAFVQASKRDGRFVLFDPHHYHFTSIIESGRNAYIYFHHDDKRTVEMQTLVDLTLGHHHVDVIGAQLILQDQLMILTESQIIVIELCKKQL